MSDFYQLKCSLISGEMMEMITLKNKCVAIINTASACGLSFRLKQLQLLHQLVEPQEWVILAMPFNAFSEQEPLEHHDLCEWFKGYAKSLIITQKEQELSHNPVMKWILKEASWWSKPRWNYYVYWINGRGQMVDWWGPWRSFCSTKSQRELAKILTK